MWVRTIRIGPRWATTDRVASVIAASRSAASAYRSSALLMILEVITTMSPGRSGPCVVGGHGRSDRGDQLGIGSDLAETTRGEEEDHQRGRALTASRRNSAVASGLLMISPVTATGSPSASRLTALSASAESITHRSSTPSVAREP